MHSGPQECRENALRCTELAETTQSPAQAQIFSNLAKQWMKLAVELEHAENLRNNLRPVLKKR
jgi:hypothetical protein